jgi:hypothetical protein
VATVDLITVSVFLTRATVASRIDGSDRGDSGFFEDTVGDTNDSLNSMVLPGISFDSSTPEVISVRLPDFGSAK